MSLRILHITVVRELTTGQLTQLCHETKAARDLDNTVWTTLAYQVKDSPEQFVHRLPWFFRPVFLRNLFAWVWLIWNARKYDYVLLRHMTFDPFAAVFARWVPNRVSVHHAREINELKLIQCNWKGQAASSLERWTGRIGVRNAKAILGVTGEIRDYELDVHSPAKNIPSHVYPNGIRVDDIEVLEDQRPKKDIEIAFMCGTFSPWHGLDILLDQFEDYETTATLDVSITLHLIGRLNLEQMEQVARIQKKNSIHYVKVHGSLARKAYRFVLARCHIGLSSLAISRKGLTEAATLKVRELLALGVPVYSGHKDTAIPDDFPWYAHGSGDLDEIFQYAKGVARVARTEVRERSRPLVEKKKWMEEAASFLEEID